MSTKKGTRLVITTASVSVVAGIIACSGGGDGGGSGPIADGGASSSSSGGTSTSSGGSSSGQSSGAVDANVPANPCGTDPVDVGSGKGKGVIRGIVRLPAPADDVQLYVDYGRDPSSGTKSNGYTGGNTGDRTSVGVFKSEYVFEFQGIPLEAEPQYYFVQAWKKAPPDAGADAGRESDWFGYCGGTTANPAPPWAAEPIVLSLSNPAKCDVDFGIGPPICLKHWGEDCTQDNQCRPPYCVCNDDSTVPGSYQCSNEGKCVGLETTCAQCNTKGGVKSMVESGCVGF